MPAIISHHSPHYWLDACQQRVITAEEARRLVAVVILSYARQLASTHRVRARHDIYELSAVAQRCHRRGFEIAQRVSIKRAPFCHDCHDSYHFMHDRRHQATCCQVKRTDAAFSPHISGRCCRGQLLQHAAMRYAASTQCDDFIACRLAVGQGHDQYAVSRRGHRHIVSRDSIIRRHQHMLKAAGARRWLEKAGLRAAQRGIMITPQRARLAAGQYVLVGAKHAPTTRAARSRRLKRSAGDGLQATDEA